ncbi:gem-associated protein 8-like isoform X2 [Limulus polyphemus]|uniref:Gem-associated protein 8-like isoform X2 n=1 Tax=Limulus polyphemus TaxID=6850 RepID=A0ABM1TG63_LIMPO|nr:gem-associated protein 8-like isoform X2 [Limulus polyphemus]
MLEDNALRGKDGFRLSNRFQALASNEGQQFQAYLDCRTAGKMASFSIQHIRSHHRLYDHYWKYYNQMVGWFRHHRMFNHSFKLHQRRQRICRNIKDSTDLQKKFCHRHQDVRRKICDHSKSSIRGNSRSNRRGTKAYIKWNKSGKSQGLVVKGIIKKEENSTKKASEVQLEMEITEEMIAFFEHSAKHKEELTKKKDRRSIEEEQYVSLENMSVTGPFRRSKLPSVTQPSTNRTKEMKELYGKAAPTIHGMETAMQLSFDRFCDTKWPKLWPNIPLKM